MEDLSVDRKELEPDTISFNTVISALSRQRGSERRAEQLLLRMESLNRPGCEPDVLSFNAVINCWAKVWSICHLILRLCVFF